MNKNIFPHEKIKWRGESTFQMLHFPVLGKITKYQTARVSIALGTSRHVVLCGRGNSGAYQYQLGLERDSRLV